MANLQITIDDGPDPVTALNAMLDELAKRKVVAAFFNLGEEVKANPGATQTILRKGHILLKILMCSSRCRNGRR
jgi:peptidoglycan/xylan/chitin deacetylase (PgdA/CDA1 family)